MSVLRPKVKTYFRPGSYLGIAGEARRFQAENAAKSFY
jgi:hypothetical protein